MGNPRKPTALKVISGTDQPCRRAPDPIVTLPLTDGIPEPPDWLPNAHAVKEFQRLAPILVNAKILTVAAVSALGHLCALHGKLVQLWAAGEAPTGHMMAQFNKLINDFGIPPAAMSKVKPGGGDDDGNPYNRRPGKPQASPKKKAGRKKK